jgi:hypothetical protein
LNTETVASWEEKLPSITEGYCPENILNADETGLCFRALPDKTLCFKEKSCACRKVVKERLTVLLCASMSGEWEKPRYRQSGETKMLHEHGCNKVWCRMEIEQKSVDDQRDNDGIVGATGQKNDTQVEKSAIVP